MDEIKQCSISVITAVHFVENIIIIITGIPLLVRFVLS